MNFRRAGLFVVNVPLTHVDFKGRKPEKASGLTRIRVLYII